MNKNTIVFLALFCCAPLASAQSKLSVVYENDIDKNFSAQVDRLREADALPEMISFVNAHIPFAEPLRLRIGATDGPLFDPEINEIWVPSAFLLEIEDRFVNADLADTADERHDAMLDVFMHTLLHEVAHAIIAQFDIPTLGKEEDAADNLANVLLLEFANDGDNIAYSASTMFALEDQDIDTFSENDFWDEHSLDIQRSYTTLCHIYGANPDDNEDLIEQGELSVDKAERCIDEYAQTSNDWLSVLDDLKPATK